MIGLHGSVRDVAVHTTASGGNTSIPSGNHRVFDSFGMPTAPITDGFLFGYTGREYDSDAGLQYSRARWYDPAVGRFVSEDPMGFSAGDTNLNRYGSNNPATGSDPSGNSWLSSLWRKIRHGVKKVAHKILDGAQELVTHPLRFIKNLPANLREGVHDAVNAWENNLEDVGHTISENWDDAKDWAEEHAKEIEIAIAVVTTIASGGLVGPQWALVLAGQQAAMSALALTAATLSTVSGALNTYQLTTGDQVGGRDFMPYLDTVTMFAGGAAAFAGAGTALAKEGLSSTQRAMQVSSGTLRGATNVVNGYQAATGRPIGDGSLSRYLMVASTATDGAMALTELTTGSDSRSLSPEDQQDLRTQRKLQMLQVTSDIVSVTATFTGDPLLSRIAQVGFAANSIGQLAQQARRNSQAARTGQQQPGVDNYENNAPSEEGLFSINTSDEIKIRAQSEDDETSGVRWVSYEEEEEDEQDRPTGLRQLQPGKPGPTISVEELQRWIQTSDEEPIEIQYSPEIPEFKQLPEFGPTKGMSQQDAIRWHIEKAREDGNKNRVAELERELQAAANEKQGLHRDHQKFKQSEAEVHSENSNRWSLSHVVGNAVTGQLPAEMVAEAMGVTRHDLVNGILIAQAGGRPGYDPETATAGERFFAELLVDEMASAAVTPVVKLAGKGMLRAAANGYDLASRVRVGIDVNPKNIYFNTVGGLGGLNISLAPKTQRVPNSLLDDIVNDANRVASPGGAISESQGTALRQNLPVIQRRNQFQNEVLRYEFKLDQARHISDWERMTGQTWPQGATPHHIIPLESGGANAWWNLMPTHGALPNHSLPGIPGPHARGGLLRGTIQQPRSILKPGETTDLRRLR